MTNEQYALEYSAVCKKQGLYPFHFQLLISPGLGRPPDHWKIVFVGSFEQVLDKIQEMDPDHACCSFCKDSSPSKVSSKKERSKMTQTLRYGIMERDEFRCKVCGRDNGDGVRLVVDHITSVSKGGKTVEENLQTLCQECNQGKGAR